MCYIIWWPSVYRKCCKTDQVGPGDEAMLKWPSFCQCTKKDSSNANNTYSDTHHAAQRLTRRKVWVWRSGDEEGAEVRKGCARIRKRNRERGRTKVVIMESISWVPSEEATQNCSMLWWRGEGRGEMSAGGERNWAEERRAGEKGGEGMWGETGIIQTIKNFTARQYNCRFLLGVRKEYVNYQMFQEMGWGEQMAVVSNLYKVIRR